MKIRPITKMSKTLNSISIVGIILGMLLLLIFGNINLDNGFTKIMHRITIVCFCLALFNMILKLLIQTPRTIDLNSVDKLTLNLKDLKSDDSTDIKLKNMGNYILIDDSSKIEINRKDALRIFNSNKLSTSQIIKTDNPTKILHNNALEILKSMAGMFP